MKNSARLGVSALVGAGFLFSFLMGTGAYAAGPQITINNGAEDLYTASGIKTSTDGTASYNSTTNTLTLDGFNGSDIYASGLEDITVFLGGENTLTMYDDDYFKTRGINVNDAALTITGDGTLKVDRTDLKMNGGSVIKAKSVTIDSAELDLSANVSTCINTVASSGSIIMNSGMVTLGTCGFAMHSENIIINGGTLTSNVALTETINIESKSKNFTLNDGEVTVSTENSISAAMMFSGNVEIKGGSLKTNGGSAGIEIFKGNSGHFSISGGLLEINNADTGISAGSTFETSDEGSYLEFSGGTTVVNAKKSVAAIMYGKKKTDNNIIIGEKMSLYPTDLTVMMKSNEYTDTWYDYTYYLSSDGEEVKNAVITDDDAVIPDDDTDADDVPVPDTAAKTPNTGSGIEGHEYVVAFVSVIPIVVASILGVRKYVRSNKKIKFDY